MDAAVGEIGRLSSIAGFSSGRGEASGGIGDEGVAGSVPSLAYKKPINKGAYSIVNAQNLISIVTCR